MNDLVSNEMPPSVKNALYAIGTSIFLSFSAIFLSFVSPDLLPTLATSRGTNALSNILVVFLIWPIFQGQNFGRILYLILFSLGLIVTIPFIPTLIEGATALEMLLQLLQTLLQGYAAFFLIKNSAKEYFKKAKPL